MAEKNVELIALHKIVRKPTKDSEEEVYMPATKDAAAKPFRVPASEAERLIGLKAARLADESVDADETDDEVEGTGTGGEAGSGKTTVPPARPTAKPGPKAKTAPAAPANPSIVE